MYKKTMRAFAIAVLSVAATGCATVNPMAFDKTTPAIDTKEKSIVLMTVDVSRSDGSRHVPEPFLVRLQKPQPQTKEDHQNFQISKGADSLQEDGRTVYLLRLALVAGEYKLLEVAGTANAFPFTSMFMVPLNMDVNVKPGSVTYMGRVTAKLRKRVGNEFRAGPVIPLLDQAVSGMSGGTWDISVDNLADKDIALFRSTFPALKNVSIDTVPLPAFDRAAYQRLWDGEAATTAGQAAEPTKPAAQGAPK